MNEVKIGLCQMMVEKTSKQDNIKKARNMINSAADQGAEIVVLPEMFNCPYNNKHFREYGESSLNDETISMLSEVSKEKNIYLVGGSIPELYEDKVYNSSFIFNNEGKLIDKHRKMHLFDIDIKNGVKFKESEVLTPGDKATIIDTKWEKMGVAICYDIRFPELTRIMALEGAKVVFIPAAFNMTTGPVHWDLSFRARALDNQIYMVGVSPARNVNYSYVAYGNSLVVDPWGKIVNKLDEKEGILVQSINLDYIDEVRESLPLLKHRRTDLYKVDYEIKQK